MNRDLLKKPAPPLFLVRRPGWAKDKVRTTSRFQSRLKQLTRVIQKRSRSRALRYRVMRFHLGQYLLWLSLRHSIRIATIQPGWKSLRLYLAAWKWSQQYRLWKPKRRKIMQAYEISHAAYLGFQMMKQRKTFLVGLQLYLKVLKQQNQLERFPYQEWSSRLLWSGFLFEAAEVIWSYRRMTGLGSKSSLPKELFRNILFHRRPARALPQGAIRTAFLASDLEVPLPERVEKRLQQSFAKERRKMEALFYLSRESLPLWIRWKQRWRRWRQKLRRSRKAYQKYPHFALIRSHYKNSLQGCDKEKGFWFFLCNAKQIASVQKLLRSSPDL